MSWKEALYNALFKKTSTFALTIVASAFVFERVVDGSADLIFDRINEGKLWHHIKPKEDL